MDFTSLLPALKTMYSREKVENLSLRKDRLLQKIKKDTEFYGDSLKIVMETGETNYSSDFAIGQANMTTSQVNALFLTRKTSYSFARLSNELIRASKNDSGAFLRLLSVQIDGAFTAQGKKLSMDLMGDGSGVICSVATVGTGSNTGPGGVVLSTSQIVVDQPTRIATISKGYVFNFSSAGSLVSVSSVPVSAVVSKIDRLAGIITFTAAVPTGVAAGNGVAVAGTFNAALSGIPAWVTATTPTAGDNFYGLDRSADPVYLAGLRYDGTGQQLESVIINAVAQLASLGAVEVDCLVVNPLDKASIDIALGTKIQRIEQKVGEIGFEKTMINGDNGPIEIMTNVFCKKGEAYLLTSDTWTLHSAGEAPDFLLTGEGGVVVPNADQLEIRVGLYGNYSCRAPGYNCRITLPA